MLPRIVWKIANKAVGLLPLFMVSAGSVIGSGWLLGTLNASKAAGPRP